MGETNKQVRVDNWGVFFLQKLQMFFSKTDYCDLTLQFEGNVQLKVHRLVMNACTEYFEFLERSCPSNEENVILMPSNLQADVIVPIVNFIYTGMLEFNMTIFERLYKAADLMSINVLTKLLDAQKHSAMKKKSNVNWPQQEKKVNKGASTSSTSYSNKKEKELPSPLPGRKLPVWKRVVVPTASALPSPFPEATKWNSTSHDPLHIPENAAKPTRFEWPEEDLPCLNMMETSGFSDVSLTSKPLLTQEEEKRATGTSFDSIKRLTTSNKNARSLCSDTEEIDMDDMKDLVKQHKIRNDLETFDQIEDTFVSNKRKIQVMSSSTTKKLKFDSKLEKENQETTISVTSKGGELDHSKIVSEILKKYPHLMKKNKNIRLKIVATGKDNKTQNVIIHHEEAKTPQKVEQDKNIAPIRTKTNGEDVWACKQCANNGETLEFHMFYLYRKHMIEMHSEQFDTNLCKYCGLKCAKQNIMMYHLYTKHGVKSPKSGSYPRCNQCPFIAISSLSLSKHMLHHSATEHQCPDCSMSFINGENFTRHVQITGHVVAGKEKCSYDCQFCTKKKIASALELYNHIRDSHLKEANKAGMVIIERDYIDDEEIVEEPEDNDEVMMDDFIVSTDMTNRIKDNKVKIISNVKVPVCESQSASSEAEALSNVASGIATSLGLVDIVVLDENQQYILQQGHEDENQEYILPDMDPGAHHQFVQHRTENQQHQDGQHQPTNLMQGEANQDIASTDELVMVLTDHDYQDGQDASNVDNSNIVVLYSHPVDGQQGQFITTSQANLVMNSTGMGLLQIQQQQQQNGGAEGNTVAPGEIRMISETTADESIEMIQREIDSHSEVNKQQQEQFYQQEQIKEEQGIADQEIPKQEPLQNEDTYQDIAQENVEPQETEQPPTNVENVTENDAVDGAAPADCEPMEIDELPAVPVSEEPKEVQTLEKINEEEEKTIPEEPSEEGVDVPPDMNRKKEVVSEDTSPDTEAGTENTENTENTDEIETEEYIPEAMEVDGGKINKQTLSEDTVDSVAQNEEEESQQNQSLTEEDKKTDNEEQEWTEGGDNSLKEGQEEDVSQSSENGQQSTTSTSQYNDDISQSSQDENSAVAPGLVCEKLDIPAVPGPSDSSTKLSILDDWCEDTDSQQSEKQQSTAMRQAEEHVNKLMDDWEEEEEDKTGNND